MVKIKSVKYNAVMNAILAISKIIFPLISFPYVSRVLSPSGIGKISFVNSVISYFLMLEQFGIPAYGVKMCARVRDDKKALSETAQEIFVFNLITMSISYVFMAIVVNCTEQFREEKILFIVIGSKILFDVLGMEWLYIALEQYTYITIRSIICKFISIIALLLMVHQPEDYVVYAGISILATAASDMYNFFQVRKYVTFSLVRKYNFRTYIKPLFMLFSMTAASTVYTNFDNIMLGFMKTDIDVGYYTTAVKLKSLLVTVITSVSAVLLPRASYYLSQEKEQAFFTLIRKAIRAIFLVASPMVVFGILFARESIYFIAGGSYDGAVFPMRIIMPTLLIIGLTNIMGMQMIIPLGKEKIMLIAQVGGAVFDFILNLLLIPKLGAGGAAIGTLVAEFVVWLVEYCAIRKIVKDLYKSVNYITIFCALFAGVFCAIPIKFLNWSLYGKLFAEGIVFSFVYGMILLKREKVFIVKNVKSVISKLKK